MPDISDHDDDDGLGLQFREVPFVQLLDAKLPSEVTNVTC